jgi:hypothetical protein
MLAGLKLRGSARVLAGRLPEHLAGKLCSAKQSDNVPTDPLFLTSVTMCGTNPFATLNQSAGWPYV